MKFFFVLVLPRIVAINGDPVIYLGQVLDLTCDVRGIPTPSVKWFHGDTAVLPSLNGRILIPVMEKLVIKHVQSSDAGNY